MDGDGTVGLRERKRATSRARAVDVALELFEARGYDGVTVADICTAADIAPRTFFRYFPTKEDVLAEPVREMSDRMAANLAAAPPELDDAAALHRAVRELGVFVVEHRERLARCFRVVAAATAVRSHPFLRLADRELDLAAHLARRGSAPSPPDWRTRLLIARTTAAFRVWLDDVVDVVDVVDGGGADPLAHLDEVLAAP